MKRTNAYYTINSTLLGSTLISAILAGGCGGSEAEPPKTAENVTTTSTMASGPTGNSSQTNADGMAGMQHASTGSTGSSKNGTNTSPSSSTADTSSSAQLTDGQILAIASALNKAEVEQGKLAQSKAKNVKVKKFAGKMVTDHQAAEQKATQLGSKASITPSENPQSTQLASESTQSSETLKGQTGTEFDKSYIDTQVKAHVAALDMIDNKLIPNAKNADLKSTLQQVRAKVDAHLKEAQDIQTSMTK